MRLEAHKPIGEGMVAAVDEQLQAQKFARRLRHLAAAVDQEIIVHPQPRARMVGALETAAAAIGLVLRDLVRMMNLAMVDAAGVDVKGQRSEEHTSELQSLMRIS